jgi:hypothetical protein
MASDGVVSLTIRTSLSLLGALVVTVGGTSLVCSWFHQEKVLHVDMGFFQNAMLGKKSHVDMRFFPNMAF